MVMQMEMEAVQVCVSVQTSYFLNLAICDTLFRVTEAPPPLTTTPFL